MVRFGLRRVCVAVRLGARSWFPTGPVLLLASLLALTSRVRAQEIAAQEPSAEPPEAYEREVGAALEDHEAGRFEAARAHFLRAHEVFPNARTLRGLGKVDFELGDYVGALRYLDEALLSQVRPLSADLRDEVVGLIARAHDYVGELVVDVKPASARITLDGSTEVSGPHARLVLTEGLHVIDFQAAGRLAQRRQLDVHGRDQLALAVELLSAEAAAPPHPQALAPAVRHDIPPRRKWWVWTVSGVALAGAATAAVLLATRDSEHRTRPVPPGADWTVASP